MNNILRYIEKQFFWTFGLDSGVRQNDMGYLSYQRTLVSSFKGILDSGMRQNDLGFVIPANAGIQL